MGLVSVNRRLGDARCACILGCGNAWKKTPKGGYSDKSVWNIARQHLQIKLVGAGCHNCNICHTNPKYQHNVPLVIKCKWFLGLGQTALLSAECQKQPEAMHNPQKCWQDKPRDLIQLQKTRGIQTCARDWQSIPSPTLLRIPRVAMHHFYLLATREFESYLEQCSGKFTDEKEHFTRKFFPKWTKRQYERKAFFFNGKKEASKKCPYSTLSQANSSESESSRC